jgi:hypothetical protein
MRSSFVLMTYAVTGAKPIKVWSPSLGALIVLCARSVCSLISQLCQPDVGVRSSTYGTAKLRWPWSKTEMDRGLQNRYSSGDQVKSDELDVNKKHGEKFSWNCNTSIYISIHLSYQSQLAICRTSCPKSPENLRPSLATSSAITQYLWLPKHKFEIQKNTPGYSQAA